MSFADFVIPSWVRIAVCAVVVGLIFGAGYRAGSFVSDHRSAAKVSGAERERDKAQDERDKIKNEFSAYQLLVSQKAAEQAELAAKTAISQSKINQGSINAYTESSGSLERRIAAGGLRFKTSQGSPGSRRLSSSAISPVGVSSAAAQSVSADPGRDGPDVQDSMDQAVQNAARDTLTLERIVQWACDQGLCQDD